MTKAEWRAIAARTETDPTYSPSYGELAKRDPAWCLSSPDGTEPHVPDDTTDPLTCAECGAELE